MNYFEYFFQNNPLFDIKIIKLFNFRGETMKNPIDIKTALKFGNLLTPLSVLVVGVIVTFITVYYVGKDEDNHIQQELEITSNEIKFKIQSRINAHIQFLRTSSSFYMSSDTITRSEWK